jgi:hypothetical protein
MYVYIFLMKISTTDSISTVIDLHSYIAYICIYNMYIYIYICIYNMYVRIYIGLRVLFSGANSLHLIDSQHNGETLC